MRVVQNAQMRIGEVDIAQIKFDARSRDDIPKILKGLQYLYLNLPLRTQIFHLLETELAPKVNKRNGRPGMELWKILVCGVVRLDLNEDYDRLHELVNQHHTLREMLGHAMFDETNYPYQTLKDNVSLFTPELLDKINQVVVGAGHDLLKKKAGAALRGRCDSFVVETDVHYPTDSNLLYDAMRKVITLTARWCAELEVSEWRQSRHNIRHLKRLLRAAQNRKRSKAQSAVQQEQNARRMLAAYEEYLTVAAHYLYKAQETLARLEQDGFCDEFAVLRKLEIEGFMRHAMRQIDHTQRRVLQGESIPHDEKVFSIFEPHTEWISKGKAGVPMELGVKVCVLEDQYQLILHHQVMQKRTDEQVTLAMVQQTQQRFPDLRVCSFDKGFHSTANQSALQELLQLVALPRKGKLSLAAQAVEESAAFRDARRAHSAVESAINALEVHGLDRCPDHGIDGFKRYVALAIVARNIHRIGAILWQQEQQRAQRKKRHADRGPPHRRAA